jgi:hypothetical protein
MTVTFPSWFSNNKIHLLSLQVVLTCWSVPNINICLHYQLETQTHSEIGSHWMEVICHIYITGYTYYYWLNFIFMGLSLWVLLACSWVNNLETKGWNKHGTSVACFSAICLSLVRDYKFTQVVYKHRVFRKYDNIPIEHRITVLL